MPLLTDRKSTDAYLSGGGGGSKILFPKDTIVPYYGSGTASNWTTYGVGAGKYLCGTTTASLVGTTTSDTNAQASLSLGTAGAHTGTVTYVSSGGYTTGSTLNNSVNNSAGAHAHSANFLMDGFSNTKLTPRSYNITLIRATADTSFIPGNTIAFRRAATGPYGEILSTNTTDYFYNTAASGSINTGTTSVLGYSGTTETGSHFHHQNVMQYYITGSVTNYWGQASGVHSHSVSLNYAQTTMDGSIILDAWFSASARLAQTDVVVMYAGDPINLPAGWYICNGNNGTINMHDRYASIANSTKGSWGTVLGADGVVSNVTINSIGSHSHVSNYNPAGAGTILYHGTQAWPHTHSVTSGFSPYLLGKLYLYFIQYKG